MQDPTNQQKLSDGWYRYFGFRLPAMEIICDGCMTEGDPNLIDQGCPVRPCVIERGLDHCGQCADYVCDRLTERLVLYEEVRERIGVEIPEEDRRCFLLPYENKARLDGLRKPGIGHPDVPSEKGTTCV
jgi:hypothetical protein